MAYRLPKTPRYTRVSLGANGDTGRRNVCHISFVKTDLRAPIAASATALLGSQALTTSGTTSLPNLGLNLDVPRNVTITLGGTTANIGAGNITITGTNIQGAVITENVVVTASTGGLLTANKAFKSVTQIDFPATTGSGVTATVGVGSKLGLGLPNLTTGQVRIWAKTTPGAENASTETLAAASASNLDATVVENNTVTVAATLNGVTQIVAYVLNYNWAVHPVPTQNVNVFGLK